MLMHYLFCIVMFSVVSSNPVSESMNDSGNLFYIELPCLTIGGICVPSDACPEGKSSNYSGLCPLQQKHGVECCHSLPTTETRCRQRGGECVPEASQCPENLTFRLAKDCNAQEKCCVLVK